VVGWAVDCWRSLKTDHLFSLKNDQGWKPESWVSGCG
jgi:hypothetical protein